MKNLKTFLLVGMLLAGSVSCFAGTINLQWNPAPESNHDHYRIYESEEDRPFVKIAEVRNIAERGFSHLREWSNYRFYVTSVSIDGIESPASNIVHFFVPLFGPLAVFGETVATYTPRLVWRDYAVAHTGYQIERSSDGVDFQVIAKVGRVSNFSDQTFSGGSFPSTFYYYRVRTLLDENVSPPSYVVQIQVGK